MGALALLGVTAAASLAGCSPGKKDEGPSSGGGRTLTVWHYYSVPGQTAGLDELGTDFAAGHAGVKVVNTYVPFDQLTNKLVQAAGAGDDLHALRRQHPREPRAQARGGAGHQADAAGQVEGRAHGDLLCSPRR
jgi:maltose-binding protein MalE